MTYNSTFQDRAAQAAQARKKALERYRSRPPVDEKLSAERLAAGRERAAARAEKAEAKKAERQAAETAAASEAAAKSAAEAKAAPPTDAERKAARDAKYAARKARK